MELKVSSELEVGSLAYVFWHWPRTGVASDRYEQDLTAFHDRLRGAVLPGLRAVTTFRLGLAPWADAVAAPPRPPLYEDWYVVAGFAALEQLNSDAVSPGMLASHDRAAASAAGGTAGLYALRRTGAPTTDTAIEPGVAHWLTKPYGMPYAAFYALLQNVLPAASVWQRQLTLGPGAEFCVVTAAPVDVSAELAPRVVPREVIG